MIAASRQGWIGVDLGSHAIKVVQLARQRGQLRLAAGMVVQRRDPWPADLTDSRASIDELVAALTLGGAFHGRRAACALPMHMASVHALEAEAGEEAARRAWIADELRSIMGTDDPGLFDYWPLDLPPQEARHLHENLIVVAVPQDWSWQVARDLRGAGLRCQVLDAGPLAMARALQQLSPGEPGESVAVVDWGFHSATFSILRDGQVVFVRPLRDCGLSAMVHNVCQSLEVSVDEAHLLLRRHGLPATAAERRPDDVPSAISDLVAEPLGRMIEELMRTLSYIKVHRGTQRPRRLWLCGGGATMNNVASLLSDKTQVAVDVWRPQARLGGADALRHCPLELLAPAIGLSLLAWESSR